MTNKNIHVKVFLILILALALVASSCGQEEEIDKIGAYSLVIDTLYEEDTGLNANIKYIALDTSLITNLNSDEKAKLLKDVEKYGYIVLDMTYEELKDEGYIKDLYFEEGILFKIEDEPMKNNSITMNVSKWRSGLGAIGYDEIIVKYTNGNWTIDKKGTAWIS